MQKVLSLVIFHGAEPVTESVESYALESWVFNLVDDPVPLPHQAFSNGSEVYLKDFVIFFG
jgi:hypothetical protein